MKIGFYSPYLNILGGGERYVLTLASHWSKTHDVRVFWDDPSVIMAAAERFSLDLSGVKTTENVFATGNIFRKLFVSRSFDLIFFLTDGSVPTTFARYNIMHFQVPFRHIRVHPIKLSRYQRVVVNSEFTKRNLDPVFGRRASVIYPPVDLMPAKAKKNLILNVGRFHPLKKQDVLIGAFRKGKFTGYSLAFAGGLQPDQETYLKHLRQTAKGLPVEFYPNVPYKKLTALYGQARIYWHAAGYRETAPEHQEHFGISTVEAMSAGCIPVVYAGGGLPEVVREGEEGYLWATPDDLIAKTGRALGNRHLAAAAVKRAKKFDTGAFTKAYDVLLQEIQ